MSIIIDNTFLTYASEILADTNSGLSGSQIVKYCNAYSLDFGVQIPVNSSDFGKFGSIIPNKRTALLKNLQAFNPEQQFHIIKELCELPVLCDKDKVKELKVTLFSRYGNFAVNENEIEYVIELTSIVMKYLIKIHGVINGGTN